MVDVSMPVKVPEHVRIVIVGGGIMGVGLLYHLAEEGCTDVLLLEKGELTRRFGNQHDGL